MKKKNLGKKIVCVFYLVMPLAPMSSFFTQIQMHIKQEMSKKLLSCIARVSLFDLIEDYTIESTKYQFKIGWNLKLIWIIHNTLLFVHYIMHRN